MNCPYDENSPSPMTEPLAEKIGVLNQAPVYGQTNIITINGQGTGSV
jgi:hypothetical protein